MSYIHRRSLELLGLKPAVKYVDYEQGIEENYPSIEKEALLTSIFDSCFDLVSFNLFASFGSSSDLLPILAGVCSTDPMKTADSPRSLSKANRESSKLSSL